MYMCIRNKTCSCGSRVREVHVHEVGVVFYSLASKSQPLPHVV